MALLKNEFSWSVSRDDTFRKCHRMYYFQYYGSWGGWSDEADESTRKIYILKQLKTRQMWAGNKVHECIEKVIKKVHEGKKTINIKQSTDEILHIMRKEFINSKKRRYLNEPKSCALFEHEYEFQLSDSEWKKTADHVVECINNFFKSDIYKRILQLSIEQWLEAEKFSHFMLNGIKVYVVPDFAFRNEDEIVIYDWKTGKEETNNKLQLGCYALYAIQKWSVKPEQIRTVEFYLSSGNHNEYNLTNLELEQDCKYIAKSAKAMKDLLDDQSSNIATEEQFSLSEVEQVCQYCNYQKICPR